MSTRNSIRGGVLLAVVVGLMAFAVPAFAQIAGSVHDLNTYTGISLPDAQTCVACHVPHDGDTTQAEAPLWNHDLTTANHAFYGAGSGTLNATDVAAPSGVSLLCLSCHDGTVALDAFGGSTTGPTFLTGNALVGTDLSNDHPVSFTYDDALAGQDGALETPSDTTSGLGGFIADDMLFGGSNNQLECASCHDVHNGTGVVPPLLRKTNAASALCTTCHIK
jgi:predicted CXXCH cytochrome family protein